MKYERFEQLPVWQDAAKLAAELFTFCTHPVFRGKGDLANQLRAALSISNNIAEGFERGTTKELISFLLCPRLAGEVRLDARHDGFYAEYRRHPKRHHQIPADSRVHCTATPRMGAIPAGQSHQRAKTLDRRKQGTGTARKIATGVFGTD